MSLLDGATLSLPHSGDLERAYPAPHNQHGTSHRSVMRALAAHEVVSGPAVRPCWGPMNGPQATSEQGLAKEMLRRLPKGSVVPGDRNFGVFSMACQARQNEHHCLFRLTEVRARKLTGGVLPNAGTDRRIVWAYSREDRRNNPELAPHASVEGRLAVVKAVDAAGRKQKLYFFTSPDLPVAAQMLRVLSQSMLPRRRKRRPSAPREIWPRPCAFPKRKASKRRDGATKTRVTPGTKMAEKGIA